MSTIPATPSLDPAAPEVNPAEAHVAAAPTWDLAWDIVDQWGAGSFPASDPPANW